MDDIFGIFFIVKDYGKIDIDVGYLIYLVYLILNSYVNILVCMFIR